MNYLGHVSRHDPLYNYLKYEIQPKLCFSDHCDYRVFKLNGSNDVYLYEEKHTGVRFVGKFFFSSRQPDRSVANRRMKREYDNIIYLRSLGFDKSPHYIASALGCNPALNELLVEEYCSGELLSTVIKRAITQHDDSLLYGKLTSLAYFLSRLHNRSVHQENVDFNEVCSYDGCIIESLISSGVIDGNEKNDLLNMCNSWRGRDFMWGDRKVTVHGDVTPENMLFGDGLNVMTFDLERMRSADRVYDVGRVAGELGHFFMAATNDRYRAEPFIGHFLWEYSCHFPDREAAFRSITKRIPFYMGINFLRIARNSWLEWNYRKRLIYEAKQCLAR